MIRLLGILVFLSIFATVVMSYIALATSIGPWIAPVLVLVASLLFRVCALFISNSRMVTVVVAGSIGGIVATACAFSFPALYFLDASFYNSWLRTPASFIGFLAALALIAGWFGMWIANHLEPTFLADEKMPFPTGYLVYNMIAAGNHAVQTTRLAIGSFAYGAIALLQTGFYKVPSLIPHFITINVPAFLPGMIRVISFDLSIMPMLVAVGFVTGHVIAVPLLCGMASRVCMLDPLRAHFFAYISNIDFLLAFCSGMIVMGALSGFMRWPRTFINLVKKVRSGGVGSVFKNTNAISRNHLYEGGLFLLVFALFAWYLKLSFIVQIYLLITTYLCVYNMVILAGKTGLAYLGRFATFVMVPAFLLFRLDYLQIITIATFVEISGGVAVDVLSGRRIAQLAQIKSTDIKWMQYLGLVIASISVGVVLYLLSVNMQLGSSALAAYKAHARALLIGVQAFDIKVMGLGMAFGLLLSYVRINTGMVLGGILMPLDTSCGLILGGLLAGRFANREAWYPLWSGVFAASSIWILIRAWLGLA
jgi:OPT oligopeptide transporter protein